MDDATSEHYSMFFVDEEGNLFVALLVDMLPTSSDFMTTLWRFWSNADK
jgi:hypothetical protein